MKKENKTTQSPKKLESLINIGPAIANRLYEIGINTPDQLKTSNPEKVYEILKQKEGGVLDRCVLYVLRGAVLNIPWWFCKDLTNKKNEQ